MLINKSKKKLFNKIMMINKYNNQMYNNKKYNKKLNKMKIMYNNKYN